MNKQQLQQSIEIWKRDKGRKQTSEQSIALWEKEMKARGYQPRPTRSPMSAPQGGTPAPIQSTIPAPRCTANVGDEVKRGNETVICKANGSWVKK